VFGDVVPGEFREAFGGAQTGDAQEPAQIAVALAIHRPDDQWGAIDRVQFAADDESQALVLGGGMGPDDACQGVAVADRKPCVAKEFGLLDKFVGVRGPFEEGEVGFAVEFDVGVHRSSI
jgi:hypothetical protein